MDPVTLLFLFGLGGAAFVRSRAKTTEPAFGVRAGAQTNPATAFGVVGKVRSPAAQVDAAQLAAMGGGNPNAAASGSAGAKYGGAAGSYAGGAACSALGLGAASGACSSVGGAIGSAVGEKAEEYGKKAVDKVGGAIGSAIDEVGSWF